MKAMSRTTDKKAADCPLQQPTARSRDLQTDNSISQTFRICKREVSVNANVQNSEERTSLHAD